MPNLRPRLDPVCYLGQQRYFVTLCCDFRQRLLVTPSVVHPVISQILRAADERGFAVITYVAMPDHAHALTEGLDAASDLQSFMHHAKQLTAYEFKKESRCRLWQPSFYDRVLRSEESMWDVVRYICENPVRKGLVERWEDYDFTGSGILTRDQLAAELAQRPSRRWRP
jgi:putative transposase